MPVTVLNVTLAGLAAVTIAVSMRVVGILLIAALMVLPVIAAQQDRLEHPLHDPASDGDRDRRDRSWDLTFSYYANLAPGGDDRPCRRRHVSCGERVRNGTRSLATSGSGRRTRYTTVLKGTFGSHQAPADAVTVVPYPSANVGVVDAFRTTARGLILAGAVAIAVGLAGGVSAAPSGSVPRLIFPVLGDVKFTDDFGDFRPQGPHEGNDLLAAKRSIAVAAEPGKIKFWTTSSSAGCMLYLYGKSGTTYLYIHLNNDVTKDDDNRGKCVPGTAYAKGLKDGAHVVAGQSVGYVGDSGDAEGGDPHLHFEVHPNDGDPTDPTRISRGPSDCSLQHHRGRP